MPLHFFLFLFLCQTGEHRLLSAEKEKRKNASCDQLISELALVGQMRCEHCWNANCVREKSHHKRSVQIKIVSENWFLTTQPACRWFDASMHHLHKCKNKRKKNQQSEKKRIAHSHTHTIVYIETSNSQVVGLDDQVTNKHILVIITSESYLVYEWFCLYRKLYGYKWWLCERTALQPKMQEHLKKAHTNNNSNTVATTTK